MLCPAPAKPAKYCASPGADQKTKWADLVGKPRPDNKHGAAAEEGAKKDTKLWIITYRERSSFIKRSGRTIKGPEHCEEEADAKKHMPLASMLGYKVHECEK